tara:strand:- start:218 stop:733 length:516 start_codon:yes stop_codon:yes gene_type:complete
MFTQKGGTTKTKKEEEMRKATLLSQQLHRRQKKIPHVTSTPMFKKKPVQLTNDNPRLFFVGVVCLVLLYIYRALLLSSSNKSKKKTTNGMLDKTRKISAEEVKKHNKVDDLWVIIDKKVYDVTEYVEEHPGGVAAIAKNAGGDASKGFRGPQHPSRVFDIVEDYLIGVLEE